MNLNGEDAIVGWSERAWVRILGAAPLKAYTRIVRHVAGIPVPRKLRPLVLGSLAQRMGMDLSEAERSLGEYPSFAELFVRRLRPGMRPIQSGDENVVSPVDGCVSASGVISGKELLQAKGLSYSLEELLGNRELAERLEGGSYITLYLRPKDYHRIHAPFDGQLRCVRRIPGTLFPVQPAFVRNLRDLFVRNERLVLEFESTFGAFGMVAVGAAAVGAISTTFETRGCPGDVTFDPPNEVARGSEVAAFNLGSTVILLFEPGCFSLETQKQHAEVRVGQLIGQAKDMTRP